MWQTYFSITQSDTYRFKRQHTCPRYAISEIIIPSIKSSVFDAFEVAPSLERERRRTCRRSRNEINSQGVGLGASETELSSSFSVSSPSPAGNAVSPCWYGQRKVVERTASGSDRKALSSLFASSRESSVTRVYYEVHDALPRRFPIFYSQPK